MSLFEYKAVDKSGKSMKGVVEATDRKAAIGILTQKGQFALELSETLAQAARKSSGPAIATDKRLRVSSKEVFGVSVQLSTALKAGLPVLDAIQIICEQQSRASIIALLEEIKKQVSAGKALSEAMEELMLVVYHIPQH